MGARLTSTYLTHPRRIMMHNFNSHYLQSHNQIKSIFAEHAVGLLASWDGEHPAGVLNVVYGDAAARTRAGIA